MDDEPRITFDLSPLQTALGKLGLRHGHKLSEAEKLAGLKPGELHERLENPEDDGEGDRPVKSDG